MATFVQLGEEDPGFDLALVLNNINNPQDKKVEAEDEGDDEEEEDLEFNEAKASDLGKLVAAGKYEEVLNQGFFGSLDKVMALENVDMIDTVFSLAFSLVHHLTEEQTGNFIKKLCGLLSDVKTSDTLSDLKLNLLCVMFNLLEPTNTFRKDVFMVLLRFAQDTGNAAACTGQFKHIPNWIKQWQLNEADEAALYLIVSQVCEQAGEAIASQDYLVKYLNTISASTDASVRESGKEQAQAAAVAAVKSFDVNPMEHPQYDCDRIRNIPAVRCLEGDTKYGSTYSLLHTFACDTVGEYLALVKKNPKLCEELGLDHEMNLQKLRALTICSLGMQQESLSYETLVDKLKVDSKDDVESVIIDAVMAGRVDAKIDQETESVIIQRTTQRTFSKDDWKSIQTKLDGWVTDLQNVRNTIYQVHAQQIESGIGELGVDEDVEQ